MSDLLLPPGVQAATSRRGFFKRVGAGTAAFAVVASGCDSDDPDDNLTAVTIDFSNDFGVLNYAYALEQLEAAFYTQVVASPYSGITDVERTLLTDIRNHEQIHRDFLAAAIAANGGTPLADLTPDFSAVTFSSRDSVLATARTFEDLGVAAYNGAGRRLVDVGLLLLAGKIVSVEARHAAAIRDLLVPRSVASVGEASGAIPEAVGASGLDMAMEPDVVRGMVEPFVQNELRFINL